MLIFVNFIASISQILQWHPCMCVISKGTFFPSLVKKVGDATHPELVGCGRATLEEHFNPFGAWLGLCPHTSRDSQQTELSEAQ